jgi:hypothetical protein
MKMKMSDIPNLDDLNRHITGLIKGHNLVAAAVAEDREPSGISIGGPHIVVKVFNMASDPPLECSKAISVAQFKRDGERAFDDFINSEAIRKLSRGSP